MPKYFGVVTVLLLVVAGCAAQSTAPAPAVNLSGYPPEFRQGYADGCASTKSGAARKRDEARYKSDTDYAQGWRDGYDICQRKN
jgi:hypothetical protein